MKRRDGFKYIYLQDNKNALVIDGKITFRISDLGDYIGTINRIKTYKICGVWIICLVLDLQHCIVEMSNRR